MPKTKTDVTPIRSGLRKRKREEVPQQTEPEVKEEWIPEDKLELWEIRAYRERLGMISHKKSQITIFGHKHKIKNFVKKFDFFHKENSIPNFESKLH